MDPTFLINTGEPTPGSAPESAEQNYKVGFAAMSPEKAHRIQQKGADASAAARRGKSWEEILRQSHERK